MCVQCGHSARVGSHSRSLLASALDRPNARRRARVLGFGGIGSRACHGRATRRRRSIRSKQSNASQVVFRRRSTRRSGARLVLCRSDVRTTVRRVLVLTGGHERGDRTVSSRDPGLYRARAARWRLRLDERVPVAGQRGRRSDRRTRRRRTGRRLFALRRAGCDVLGDRCARARAGAASGERARYGALERAARDVAAVARFDLRRILHPARLLGVLRARHVGHNHPYGDARANRLPVLGVHARGDPGGRARRAAR